MWTTRGQHPKDSPARRWRGWPGWFGWLLIAPAIAWTGWTLASSPAFAEVHLAGVRRDDMFFSLGVCATSQVLICIRWLPLLRAAGVGLRPLDAMATAATADALGFVALGSAAADVYRIAAGAHRCGGQRLALATVVLADRVAGLLALIWLAAIGATLATQGSPAWNEFRAASLPVLWGAALTGAALVATALVIDLQPLVERACPSSAGQRLILPLLAMAARFRSQPSAFLAAFLTSLVTHSLNAAVVWSLAGALVLARPSWPTQCLISSLAMCATVLPLPLGGLGAVELVAEELTRMAVANAGGAGLVATLAARLMSLPIAAAWALVLAVLSRRRGHETADEGPEQSSIRSVEKLISGQPVNNAGSPRSPDSPRSIP